MQQRSVSKDDANKSSSESQARGSAIARQKEKHKKDAAVDRETQRIMDSIDGLEFGTWFEFYSADQSAPIQLKLAWYSQVSDNYMFVNSNGVKAESRTKREFALGMRRGSIVRMESNQKSFLERALESIAGKMNKPS